MAANAHPQFAEVINYLKAKQDCSIVHSDSNREVSIEFDRKETWHVRATLKNPPDSGEKEQCEAIGLNVTAREITMHFGPSRGKTISLFLVMGSFQSVETAAQAALLVANNVWRLPVTERLWITALHYDDRG